MKTLHMETTKIPPEKTAQQVATLLGQAGACAVQTEYKNRKVVALSFTIEINTGSHSTPQIHAMPFRLPIQVDPLFIIFQGRRSRYKRSTFTEQDQAKAERVAWRQILRWVEAQLALIEIGMVKMEEVFLPYMQVGINETFYQRLAANSFQQLLPPPPGE